MAEDEPQKTRVDLDLDTITKPSKTIRVDGRVIKVEPVELGGLFKLFRLYGDLSKSDGDISVENLQEADETFKKLKATIIELVPGLKDAKLNFERLIAILELVVSMAIPSDLEELEKRGIKLSPEQKKILSQSSKKSEDSSTSTPATPSNPS